MSPSSSCRAPRAVRLVLGFRVGGCDGQRRSLYVGNYIYPEVRAHQPGHGLANEASRQFTTVLESESPEDGGSVSCFNESERFC